MFFKKKTKCTHPRVSAQADSQYCPDCGKYIENKWYLTRCSCCNIKRKSIMKHDRIEPFTKYCPNCGAAEFFVEPVKTINFIDINFAVLIKEEAQSQEHSRNQAWVESESEPVKLLGLYAI